MAKNENNISENKNLLNHPEKISPWVNYVAVITEPEKLTTKVWPHQTFADWQMKLVLSGQVHYRMELPESELILSPGELALMPPGICHTQRLGTSGKTEFDCVHFLFNRNRDIPFRLKGPKIFRPAEPEQLHTLFCRLQEAFHTPGIYMESIASGIVKEIFLRLFLTRETEGKNIGAMTRFLDINLQKHPGRTDLAERFHCAPEYINQLFKKHLGMSPGEYVQKKLARSAYPLLMRGDSSIKEIAELLGFKNQFHFSRVFRKVYGIPPISLKKKRTEAPPENR